MLTDDFLLIRILVQQLCDGDVRAEEILVDGVVVSSWGLLLDGIVVLSCSVVKIGVIDCRVTLYTCLLALRSGS